MLREKDGSQERKIERKCKLKKFKHTSFKHVNKYKREKEEEREKRKDGKVERMLESNRDGKEDNESERGKVNSIWTKDFIT